MSTLINKLIKAIKKLNASNPGARNPMDACNVQPYYSHSITPSGK